MLSSDDHKKFFELSGWVSGFLAGTLPEEQKVKLDAWLEECEEHRMLFERICAGQTMRDKIRCYREEDLQTAFQEFLRKRKRLQLRRRVILWTACAVAVMVLGGAWLQWQRVRLEGAPAGEWVQETGRPDSVGRRPVLTLASGERIVIPEGESGSETTAEGRQILMKSGLSGQSVDTSAQPGLSYNTVSVPPMCDFHFTLSDGTKVWMNAASYLRYPVQFASGSRVVYVSGEVCLEVAKDARRPFAVVTDGLRIEVLGTSFNVRAYPHEAETKVTLAEGKVAARVGEKDYTLAPGNQLCVGKTSGEVKVQPVDVGDVLSWKRGLYVFKKCSLAEVASTLQCWYDVEIILTGEAVARTTYTGVVNKEEAIEVFLKRLEEVSDVKCLREGDIISIQ